VDVNSNADTDGRFTVTCSLKRRCAALFSRCLATDWEMLMTNAAPNVSPTETGGKPKGGCMKRILVGCGALFGLGVVVLGLGIGYLKMTAPKPAERGTAPCPPLKITMAEKEITPTYALALSERTIKQGVTGYAVHYFTAPGVTCEKLMAAATVTFGYGKEQTEVIARVGDSQFTNEVVLDHQDPTFAGSTANMKRDIGVFVDAAPHAEGDDVTLCVPQKVTWELNAGREMNKTGSVVGTFTGKYCGEKKMLHLGGE